MDKNKAINKAIKAIHKVKPSMGDARMSESHRKDYDEWMEVIRILESLKDHSKGG
jgi:hypothetical protein